MRLSDRHLVRVFWQGWEAVVGEQVGVGGRAGMRVEYGVDMMMGKVARL